MKDKLKNTIKHSIFNFIILSLILLITTKSFATSIKLSFTYVLLFLIPFIPWTLNLKTNLLEKIALTNILALSYSFIFFLIDTIFEIKLLKGILLLPLIIILVTGLAKRHNNNSNNN
jgi:hypothetical protein